MPELKTLEINFEKGIFKVITSKVTESNEVTGECEVS